MKRREFIRIVGGITVTSAVAPQYGFGADTSGLTREGVLVEAGAFQSLGGWKLDTQHYQQMGGCYLLAHGLGQPVANAMTAVTLPEGGKWNVHVRTRDWCPGDWESPGQFKVLVNDAPLEPTFGVGEEPWGWQHGGQVEVAENGKVVVELKDLTGFDGRCDSIFFTKSENPNLPNDNLIELSAWKDRVTRRDRAKVEELDFDLVVVGGGISGCAAALAARSQGIRVALIQDRPLFGGNASEEIRVHTIGIPGKGQDILKQIDTEHYPNGSAEAIADQEKRESAMKASGADLFAHHIACGIEKDGNRIASVEARDAKTGVIRRFKAPVFVDATGDGWLGYWAGVPYRYGRESHKEFGESWEQHGDLWSPEVPDNRVMGTSVLWNCEEQNQRVTFPEVPWAMPVAKKKMATGGEWYWEYSQDDLDQTDDAEKIRDHMLRAIYGSFANAKKHPKNATQALKWVAYVGGKRESRRLMGDYLYTMQDMTERREFHDTVVEEIREIDAHYQTVLTGDPVDFISKALFRKTGGMYYIPFRCFVAKDMENLMMAGRCFSCSHIGLCGPRVMKTCGQMGIAVGYAAALCKKHKALPRAVGESHIDELRKLIGYA